MARRCLPSTGLSEGLSWGWAFRLGSSFTLLSGLALTMRPFMGLGGWLWGWAKGLLSLSPRGTTSSPYSQTRKGETKKGGTLPLQSMPWRCWHFEFPQSLSQELKLWPLILVNSWVENIMQTVRFQLRLHLSQLCFCRKSKLSFMMVTVSTQ